MATIDGIYMTDDKDNLIFEYPTSSSLSLKTILSAIANTGFEQSRDDSIIEISSSHALYKFKSDRVRLYALTEALDKDDSSLKLQTLKESGTDDDLSSQSEYENFDSNDNSKQIKDVPYDYNVVNPNTIFVFLSTINKILIDYFGSPLSVLKIEGNYDIMCNLMQEIFEGGSPYITDINQLRDLVSFQNSLGSKFLSTTNRLASAYVTSSSSFTSNLENFEDPSNIPWRRPNVKYTNNELFVDLKEEINVVLTNPNNKNKSNSYRANRLVPTLAVIKGQIDFTSHLSGVPDIQLLLDLNGHSLGIPSFHKCIRLDSWVHNEGNLSFIPPDGKTTIMDYTIDLDQNPTSKILKSLGLVNVDYKDRLGLKKNEFEITLNINLYKNVSKISDLKVSIRTNEEGNLKTLRVSHGDLQVKSYGNFEWTFDKQTSMGINPILRGVIEPYEDSRTRFNDNRSDKEEVEKEQVKPTFPESIALSYNNTGSLPSGIRVNSLKITRGLNKVKPYKGVKYITTTGDFVIR